VDTEADTGGPASVTEINDDLLAVLKEEADTAATSVKESKPFLTGADQEYYTGGPTCLKEMKDLFTGADEEADIDKLVKGIKNLLMDADDEAESDSLVKEIKDIIAVAEEADMPPAYVKEIKDLITGIEEESVQYVGVDKGWPEASWDNEDDMGLPSVKDLELAGAEDEIETAATFVTADEKLDIVPPASVIDNPGTEIEDLKITGDL
jgi:hypothetical protein